ncbi:MAG: metal ABC transporter permease, partial [Cyclobacteriaceae bacterium]|nr:metal ABC transporter permease [Cyclobacteriaceae bacterium]
GKAASLVGNDLAVFAVIALVLILAVFFLFKEFTLLAFDPQFGKVIGLPVKTLEFTLTSLTVLAVVVGIQSVGVVLMAAMLITPAAAARFWTNNIRVMVLLAATFGAVSGIIGAYISYIAPSMPTGPWIVVSISTIAFISFFFAPQKGIIFRMNIQVQLRKKINDENILKAFYHIGEYEESFFTPRTPEQLINKREFESIALQKGLSRLKSQGFLKKSKEGWILTEEGKNKGRRIVKLHRLWELYLTKYMSIAPDHVHDDAETIEHIITPEIEAQLEQLLEYPEKDPHESEIPY